jgi:hypothetical protein
MATINTEAVPFQYFSGSGAGDVIFNTNPVARRYVKEIILTVSGNATISFDGTNFFPITNGTYNWQLPLSHIWFNAGTWAGVGIAK